MVGAIVLAGLSAACASTGAVPKPFPVPRPAASPEAGSTGASSRAALGIKDSVPSGDRVGRANGRLDSRGIVRTALDLRGIGYQTGGADPGGFDCSGFTQYVFAQHAVELPRQVREQFSLGKSVRPSDLHPGDLLFFATDAPGASHVAIAIGSDRFVHAPSAAGVVRVERLDSRYWSERFVGARRID